MKSKANIISSILAFLIPAICTGGLVATTVSSHLTKANYSPAEIQLGTIMFFAATFLFAGLFGIALSKVLTFRQQKSLSISALLAFHALGLIFAYATLTDFYDHPSGHVTEWFLTTFGAFCLFGALPASLTLVCTWLKNRSTSFLEEAVEPQSPTI